MQYEIIVDCSPSNEDKQVVYKGIESYNAKILGENTTYFATFLKDKNGDINGGVLAWYISESMYVDVLWLKEHLRNQGYGTKLLLAAEAQAVQYGCKYSTLDTFSFQAEDFYLKNGYKRLGEVNNFIFEYSRIFLRKKLQL